jgi:hypothetical protein
MDRRENDAGTCWSSRCLATIGGIYIQTHRQQGDLMSLILFFKIRKVGQRNWISIPWSSSPQPSHRVLVPILNCLYDNLYLFIHSKAGIAQLVWRRARSCRARGRPDRLWGPPSLLSNVCRASCSGDKAAWAWSWALNSIYYQGQEWWSYSSTPSYVFMAWCLIKHRYNFTFMFTLHIRPLQ